MKYESTNIYVIYKFKMGKQVDEKLEYMKNSVDSTVKLDFYKFPSRYDKNFKTRVINWKRKAKKKILGATFVLFFYDPSYYSEAKEIKNVKWELELVKKSKRKLVIIYSHDNKNTEFAHQEDNKINETINSISNKEEYDDVSPETLRKLFGSDYSESKFNSNLKIYNFQDGVKRVVDFAQWSVESALNKQVEEEFSQSETMKAEYYELLIKEYEIMIQTSEQLIERRQSMSEKYRTLCITLISLITASLALNNLLVSGLLFLLVGIIITFLSKFWILSLEEYAQNNEGKYAIINLIEARLPARMFDVEYEYNKYRGIKTFSEREKSLPKLFKVTGIIFAIFGAILLILSIVSIIKTGNFNIIDIINIIINR